MPVEAPPSSKDSSVATSEHSSLSGLDKDVMLATLENALALAVTAGASGEEIAEAVEFKAPAAGRRVVVTALQEAAGTLGAAACWTTDRERAGRLRAAADRARDAAKGLVS